MNSMDSRPLPSFIADLAIVADVSRDRIQALTLTHAMRNVSAYAGERGTCRWLLPKARNGKATFAHGTVFCPACLREDDRQYVRQHWRMSWSVFCTRHQEWMHDRCPDCGRSFSVERSDRGRAFDFEWPRRLRCHNCFTPLDSAESSLLSLPTRQTTQLLSACQDAARTGWTNFLSVPVFGLSWFLGLHTLCQFVHSAPAAQLVWADTLSVEPWLASYKRRRSGEWRFDFAMLDERRTTVAIAAALLNHWPTTLASTLQRAGISLWDIPCINGFTAFWLQQVLDECSPRRGRKLGADQLCAALRVLSQKSTTFPTKLQITNTLGISCIPARLKTTYEDQKREWQALRATECSRYCT